jgi:hypothetical protein
MVVLRLLWLTSITLQHGFLHEVLFGKHDQLLLAIDFGEQTGLKEKESSFPCHTSMINQMVRYSCSKFVNEHGKALFAC